MWGQGDEESRLGLRAGAMKDVGVRKKNTGMGWVDEGKLDVRGCQEIRECS